MDNKRYFSMARAVELQDEASNSGITRALIAFSKGMG